MLNTIKTLIQEKTKFLEAADVIFEDVSNLNLDDQIILGLESANDVPMDGGSEEVSPVEEDVDDNLEDHEEDDSSKEEDDEVEDDEKDDETKTEDDNIINSNIIDDDPEKDDDSVQNDNDELLDSDIDDTPPATDEGELSLPGDDLSNPPVSQGNEDDNILNVEIDLGSNTVKDVLPVPPANAGDVVPGNDDTASQHIDSGFSNENPIGQEAEESSSVEEEPVIEESAEEKDDKEDKSKDTGEEIKESFWSNYFSNTKVYSEAITIGDDDGGEETSEEKPADGSTESETAPVENTPEETPTAEESPVTTAVKDKIAEMDTEEPVQKDNKEDLLKKLGNITKSLEDAKKAVMNSIQ